MDQAASAGIREERDATRAIGYYWHCARGAGGDDEARCTCVHLYADRAIRQTAERMCACVRLGCRRTDVRKDAHASVRILRASAPNVAPLRGVKKLHPLGRRRSGSVGVRRLLTVCTWIGCRSLSFDFQR